MQMSSSGLRAAVLRMAFAIEAVVKYSLRISMKCRMKSGDSVYNTTLYLNVCYLTMRVVYG
jgi:hypothetical protein